MFFFSGFSGLVFSVIIPIMLQVIGRLLTFIWLGCSHFYVCVCVCVAYLREPESSSESEFA